MHSAITQRLCPLSTAVHAVHQEKVRIGIFDNVWGKIARNVYEFISNPTVLYFFSADVHSAFLCGAKVVLNRQVLQAHVLPDKCVPEVLTHELTMGPVYRCSALSDFRSSKVQICIFFAYLYHTVLIAVLPTQNFYQISVLAQLFCQFCIQMDNRADRCTICLMFGTKGDNCAKCLVDWATCLIKHAWNFCNII